jgi:uncharacterized membrane protein YedE/YeeE
MAIEWLRPLAGGLLIGSAAGLMAVSNRHVAGISGIFGQLLRGAWGAQGWRLLFVAGLLLPALALGPHLVQQAGGIAWLAGAGLLVGIGTSLARGCTSGHGVCGLSQGSPRSLAATATFMATAAVTVWLVRHGIRP